MGQLTAPDSALLDPQTKQPVYMGKPQQVLDQTRQMLQSRTNNLDPSATSAPMPTIGKPSFQQAASFGATPGGANALSPGLNKAGKLATLLTSGLQGAMAGRAASEQAVIQSGGRRSGGGGMGFEAGYTLPWQRAEMQQKLAQGQAQTQLLQAQSQMVPTPYGQMPAGLAKLMFPAMIRAEGQKAVQGMKGETAENVAGINKRFVVDPSVGIYDTQQGAWIPGSQQGITVTPEIAKDLGLPAEFVGKPMKLSDLASNKRADVFQNIPVQGAQGPALVNRKTAAVTPLGLGSPGVAAAQARPVQAVVDPNNPGNVTYTTAGQATKTGMQSPQSATTQAARTEAKSEVPTQIGNQRVAFNTAMQHADLLQTALTYMNDPKNPSNIRAWNSVKNRFKTEFGSADVTNFQVIANAYTREVTKMLSGGHITDAEISAQGATIPAKASPQQILGALHSYKALAQSKLNMLNQQANAAKGTANKSGNDPLGIR